MASLLDRDPETGVPLFQLLQWKYAIRLEGLGLHHSRGSVTQLARTRLGLAKRAPRAAILAVIQARLDTFTPNQEA